MPAIMFEAFELHKLVEKLPLKICAITTWGDSFMISTIGNKNDAHLLVYQLKLTSRRDYEAKLNRTLKKFTSKPITQLAAIPEYGIFLGLADNEIFFADLEQFAIIGYVTRSRGASHFSVDWQKLRGQVGFFERELRLCVATKKKLYLYQWKKNNFYLVSDLNFPDTPRAAAWVGNNLIICIKKDLYHINMNGDSKEMFSIGASRTEPCLYPLMNGEILVLKDEMQVSLDTNAKPTQPQSLTWSEQPISIEHVQPYIIALIPRGIEIRAFEQKVLIQSMKPESAIKFITSNKSTLLASNDAVYNLEPLPYDGQVRSCIKNKQFELALSIAELIEETPEEAVHRRSEILRRLAFHHFTMFRFEESLKNYLEIKENPINVIGLFPNLLPGDLRQKLAELHPTKPPTISGDDLEEGMKHLTKYLTQMRYQKVQELQRHHKVEEGVESQENKSQEESVRLLKDTLGLIDTTLLKCYVKTGNSTLIGSLVRLPDNYLHVSESERVLRSENYFKELIDLYQSKGQHKEALKLLKQFSSGPAGPLMGVWPSIDYLQNLGKQHIDLILKYSRWIIQELKDSDDPLRIFTEDVLEVKSLPRRQVLDHLEKYAPSLVIPYLEHIINVWGEDNIDFHRKLIEMYQEGVEKLLPEYKRQSEEKQKVKAGDEPGMLGVLRTKLLKFLRESQHYVAAEHISSFPQDDLFEERALLLSRLGRHEVALAIYAHVLKEPEMAEEYCRVNYDAEKEDSRDVYLCLIKMYLSPPNLAEFGIHVPEGSQPEANVKDALTVLTQHHHLIDTTKVLDLLPSGTKLKDIQEFLTMVVQERTLLRRRTQLMKSLLLAEHLQVVQQKIRNQAPYFVINDHNSCDACNKRLGTSAFARYPDGTIEHYYCAKEKLTTPTSESTTTVPQETLPLAGGAGLEWTSSSSSDVPVRRDSWSNPFDD